MLEYLAPFRSRRMLVCSNDGRVEQEIRELGVPTKRLEHLSPDTAFAPATEPFADRPHGPKRSGRFRHGEPVRAIQNTALMNDRLSPAVLQGSLFLPGR